MFYFSKRIFFLLLILMWVSLKGMTVHGAPKSKNLFLTVKVFHQEKLPPLPKGIVFKGDYRRVAIVKFSRTKGVLRFDPIREGYATLAIIDRRGRTLFRYNLDVKRNKLSKIIREIRSLLGSIEGIEIKVINNRVVVDGEILLPGDMNRIVSTLSQYSKEEVFSLVSLSPLAQRKIAQFIERDINNPEVQVRIVNGRFILEGTVNSEAEKKKSRNGC